MPTGINGLSSFNGKQIIIGVPLVLNELPKCGDKIKTQSALDPDRKNVYLWDMEKIQSTLYLQWKIYFYFLLQCYYGTWKLEKIQSDSVLAGKKYFRFCLRYFYGEWDLIKFQLVLNPNWKKKCFWLHYHYEAWNFENINRQPNPGKLVIYFILIYCIIMHGNRNTVRSRIESLFPQK